MTAICPTTDGSKATFTVGTNSYVVFYNGTGSLSLAGWQGVLKVVPFVLPPVIAGQPQSQYVVTGTTLQMKATGISGNTPFGYRWQLSSTNLANNATFSGVNSNILTIANAALGNSGPYQLIITNLYGSTTSSVA